jgi:uncharacterized protein (DUF4415 family)
VPKNARLDATSDEETDVEDPDSAPEWTEEDFDRAEVWHGDRYLGRGLDFREGRRIGRPKGKLELVTLCLDREVLDHFRAGGPGWQTRLNEKLRALLVPRPRAAHRANARLIAEVLQAMQMDRVHPADIRAALRDKGVVMNPTSFNRALHQLEARREIALSADSKTWRYLGPPA